MEKFIARIRESRCLWDPSHSDYREAQVKDDVWARVVLDCNDSSIPNIRIAKAKWRRLRDSHREALKRAKLGRNKLLPQFITTWKYARMMQFLEPHMKHRITDSNDVDADANSTNTEEKVSNTKTDEMNCDLTDNSMSNISNLEDGDALKSFFDSMFKSTKDMPSWMQTQLKKRVFAVVIEAEEQLSSKQNSTDACSFSNTVIKTESFTEDSCDYS